MILFDVNPFFIIAKLFKCDESKGGLTDKWIVTLFNYDKGNKRH